MTTLVACEYKHVSPLRLQKHGEAQAGLDQYAIVAFAEALACVPQVLAENAGMKAKDMISMLYAAHAKGEQNAGVDISNDYPGTVDAAKAMSDLAEARRVLSAAPE